MATLLCDECLRETEANELIIMRFIDILRTVCQDCGVKLRKEGWSDVFETPEGNNDDKV